MNATTTPGFTIKHINARQFTGKLGKASILGNLAKGGPYAGKYIVHVTECWWDKNNGRSTTLICVSADQAADQAAQILATWKSDRKAGR